MGYTIPGIQPRWFQNGCSLTTMWKSLNHEQMLGDARVIWFRSPIPELVTLSSSNRLFYTLAHRETNNQATSAWARELKVCASITLLEHVYTLNIYIYIYIYRNMIERLVSSGFIQAPIHKINIKSTSISRTPISQNAFFHSVFHSKNITVACLMAASSLAAWPSRTYKRRIVGTTCGAFAAGVLTIDIL